MKNELERTEEPDIQKIIDGYIACPDCKSKVWKVKVESEGDITRVMPTPSNVTIRFECECGYKEREKEAIPLETNFKRM